jgi:EAL domain-containing protein (putative c-di-GMP-specific phosphodiesterase class I)
LALGSFARLKLSGRLFLNLSAASLLDPGFAPQTVLDALTAAGLDSSQVVFEITEDSAALDCTKLRQATSRLRAEGIEVAISVLGVGLSSGRICSELKPSFVKIDRHFIADLHRDPRKMHFVRSIRQLADGAHACVIAEGVETTSELAVLNDLGIPYAQGHLVARPSPVPIRLLPRDVEACLARGSVCSLWRRQATSCTSRSADW